MECEYLMKSLSNLLHVIVVDSFRNFLRTLLGVGLPDMFMKDAQSTVHCAE